MLKIRLKRIGKKHQPSFRIVVQERRSKLKGKFIDDLGSYSPISKKITINAEKVKKWLGFGAQPSDTVHNLLIKNKIITGTKINLVKKPKNKKSPAENSSASAAPSQPEAAQAA
jgi:small subunit ribosomal protein S16